MGEASRRDLVLTKARELFAQHGFDGTPISRIAVGAGVSKAAVSFHFESKEAMLAELIEPLLSDLEAVFAGDRDASWPDGVLNIARDFLDVLIRHHKVAVWVDSDRGVHDRHPFGERLLTIHAMLVDVICAGSERTSDRVKAIAAAGGFWRPIRSLSAEEIAAHRDAILGAALSSYGEITRSQPA